MAYGAPLSVAQLAAECGMSTKGARFVLESLVSQGMVSVLGQPRSQLYRVASQHPMTHALKALFQHERSRWESVQQTLREAFASWSEVRAVWLYGSVARGEDRPNSDVDIALVLEEDGVEGSHRVRDAVQALGDSLSLHFSAVVFSPAELAAIRPDDAWWSDVMRDAKVLKGLGPAQEMARQARSGHPA